MKQSFFGKYYKFISDNKTVFSCIDSVANEGKMLQVITQDGSYLIDKEAEGYYVLVEFESTAEFPAELDRKFRINEDVIRSMIIKKEDE